MTKRARVHAAVPVLRWLRRTGAYGLVGADVDAFVERRSLALPTGEPPLLHLMAGYPEFRNVLYYRLVRAGHESAAVLLKTLWPPMPLLEIGCPVIGPGFVISHGHGTILAAHSIGSDFWVHHQVTVGWTYGDRPGMPTIGDDVFIGAGAKVLGSIRIGSGARIGANAVVLQDVPPGATAVGVPARISPG